MPVSMPFPKGMCNMPSNFTIPKASKKSLQKLLEILSKPCEHYHGNRAEDFKKCFDIESEYCWRYAYLMLLGMKKRKLEYGERHHIVPFALYVMENHKVKYRETRYASENNLSVLTYQEHTYAHYCAAMCGIGPMKGKMAKAFFQMYGTRPKNMHETEDILAAISKSEFEFVRNLVPHIARVSSEGRTHSWEDPIQARKDYYYANQDECNERSRKYYQAHQEEIREKGRNYYKCNAEERKAYSKKYYHENIEKCNERSRKYNAEHREELNAKSREYVRTHQDEIKAYREAHKEERKEYGKQYREAHREELRERSLDFYHAHKEELDAKSKAYQAAHKEERAAYAVEYYKANKDKRLAYSAKYYNENKDKIQAREKAYREKHADEIKARQKAYREAHRDELNAKQRQLRAEMKAAGYKFLKNPATGKKEWVFVGL